MKRALLIVGAVAAALCVGILLAGEPAPSADEGRSVERGVDDTVARSAETVVPSEPVLLAPVVDDELAADVPVEETCYASIHAQVRRPGGGTVWRGGADRFDGALFEFGVCASRDDLGEPYAVVELDDRGTAIVEFPWQLVEDLSGVRRPYVWLRVSGNGLIAQTRFMSAPDAPGQSRSLSVTVRPGVVVKGRVVDSTGRPVAGRVSPMSDGEHGVASSNGAAIDDDGFFSCEVYREGPHRMKAEGTSDREMAFPAPEGRPVFDLGTGLSGLFDVTFGQEPPVLDIVVTGPGVVQGLVVDSDGRPAAGLMMRVSQPKHAGASRVRLADLEAGGLTWARTTTDADGRFVFQGLRLAEYEVWASHSVGNASGETAVPMTSEPVLSDGQPLALEVTRPHLAIHVRHADGELPAVDIATKLLVDVGYMTRQSKSWPSEPGVVAVLAPEHAHHGAWSDPTLDVKPVADGEFIAEVDVPDVALDVGVFGGGVLWDPVRVDVPLGAGRIDVDVVLRAAPQPGTLALDVVDSRGRGLSDDVHARIIDPKTGVVLVDHISDRTDEMLWTWKVDLPAGKYLVHVEGRPKIDFYHGTVRARRQAGTFEQVVTVTTGAEFALTAELDAPARLTARVNGLPTDEDRQAVRDRYMSRDGPGEEFVETRAAFVFVRLEREGRWPVKPDFARFGMGGTTAAGLHLYSHLTFGSEETSGALSAGTYTLVATTQSGRTRTRGVTFVPGETLSVVLDFN